MHPLEHLKFGQGPVLTPELILAVALLAAFAFLIILSMFYLHFKRRQERMKLFFHLLGDRGFSHQELQCMFRYLDRKKVPLELILESEAMAKETLNACKIELAEGLKKLGFDTQELIKKFMEHQKELRKKWNSK